MCIRDSLEEKKYKALCNHVGWMLNLFVMACSIPAGIRLAQTITGQDDGMIVTAAILVIIFGLNSIAIRYVNKMMPNHQTKKTQLD